MRHLMTLLAVIVGLLLTGSEANAVVPYPPGLCVTTNWVYEVQQRKGISCRKAKKVVRAFRRAGVTLPECRGDGTVRLRGWRGTGVGKLGPSTRFTNGRKSFRLSGQGAC